MSNTRLRNEPLEKASGGTSYADERDDEEVRRVSRVSLPLFVHPPQKNLCESASETN